MMHALIFCNRCFSAELGFVTSQDFNLPAEALLPLVYDQLRELAKQRMAQEATGHTLQATALVHEIYLRLSKAELRFNDRAHFFHTAAEAMRRILIEHARGKHRQKRGGDAVRQPLNVLDLAAEQDSDEILAFDEAIEQLAIESPQTAAVVRFRFYAGLTVDETAESLGLSPRTVNREWTYARAWLYRRLYQPEA
jgi:RNA polymerase sigma factor (TIGR02999 family)